MAQLFLRTLGALLTTLLVTTSSSSEVGSRQCAAGEKCENPQGDCADIVGAEVCAKWVSKGHCQMYRNQMGQYCRKSCDYCGVDTSDSYYADKRKKGKPGVLSIFDTRKDLGKPDKSAFRNWCRHNVKSAFRKAVRGMCHNLEDESRLNERGFVVMRNLVPEDERQRMFEFSQAVDTPTRLMCGASDVQPQECMLHGEEIKNRYPETHARLQAKLTGWLKSGFNHEAELGWPLHMSGSEFVAINSWGFPKNSSCVFMDVVNAAANLTESCWAACPESKEPGDKSLTSCWYALTFLCCLDPSNYIP